MWSNSVFYPDDAPGDAKGHVAALTSQAIARVIMMGEGGCGTLGAPSWRLPQRAKEDAERQRLLDLAEPRGVPLSDARAERAAAAGQGARLEERIKEST